MAHTYMSDSVTKHAEYFLFCTRNAEADFHVDKPKFKKLLVFYLNKWNLKCTTKI